MLESTVFTFLGHFAFTHSRTLSSFFEFLDIEIIKDNQFAKFLEARKCSPATDEPKVEAVVSHVSHLNQISPCDRAVNILSDFSFSNAVLKTLSDVLVHISKETQEVNCDLFRHTDVFCSF